MPETSILTQSGKFVVGCNYWASHAGTEMWRAWRPEIIDEDLHLLAANGVQVMRVFPLWPDFQPLSLLRGGAGAPAELRFGEEPLPEDEAGRAGVSAVMVQRFAEFASMANRYHLKLIVGLITGWMSGRLFVPPAFEGLNVLTDPFAIQWQVRFVRYFVHRFKDDPAVLAWDLGNECNCMASVPSRAAAWAWTAAITNAIRVEDSTRPVVSGMHSLTPGRGDHWTMQDQGELTDLLTTHPYPYFTPHCDQDPANTIRTILHSTAESRFYADIGSKPCLVEEVGTLGPILASEAVAADFVRTALYSNWAHDCHGLLWWCAFDQLHLEHAPYDWAACERELGLIRQDRRAKPVLAEMGQFGGFLKSLPFEALPPRQVEAVCILTDGQDQWGAAYSAFILAKQAGFDLAFQYADQPLKPAGLYLLPCFSGNNAIPRRRWLDLLGRVQQGASLYISHLDGLLSPFNEPLGLEVQTRQRRAAPAEMVFGSTHFNGIQAPIRLTLAAAGAEVLGREPDGNPLFTNAAYGQGKIYFLGVPLELSLTHTPGVFHTPGAQPFWQVYRAVAQPWVAQRAVIKIHSLVGLTEHALDETRRLVIAINYSPDIVQPGLSLQNGWKAAQVWRGAAAAGELPVAIPPNDALVFTVRR